VSKDKKKSSKKVKSQAEAAVEAMANVTGNAKAAQKALKAGKKLAAEAPAPEPSEWAVEGEKPEWGAALDGMRVSDAAQGANEKVMRILRKQRVKDAQKGNMDLDWNEPNLTLEAKPRPVEVVEPVTDTGLTEKERKRFQKDMKKAGKLAQAGIDKVLNDMQGEPGVGEPVSRDVLTEGVKRPIGQDGNYYVEHPETRSLTAPTNVGVTPEPSEPLAAVTTEDQGGVPTSAEPRTRTDNLLVMLKQAQESADLDSRTQTVVCPRKYVTKNYGVQLVKKYAAEGIFAEATEDTFVPPDRDHPKGMWEVTLKVHPKAPTTASISGGPDIGGFDGKPAEAKLEKGETVITAADAEKLLKKGIKKAKKGKK
jgi:hypothetical protein